MHGALASALLATLILAARPAVPPAGSRGSAAAEVRAVPAGRYLLHATARVDTDVLASRDHALDVLALVSPGATPGEVRLHLRARGQSCELRGRVEGDGALLLATGQGCRIEIDASDARSDVEARLRAGGGRLARGELSLQLTWDVAGTLRTRLAIPGAEELGEAWTPPLPLRGVVESSGRGTQERAP